MAFFDKNVFNQNTERYVNQDISKTYNYIKKKKKRLSNEQISEIEHGSFSPLVISGTGGMGRKCKIYSLLAEMISSMRDTSYSMPASCI